MWPGLRAPLGFPHGPHVQAWGKPVEVQRWPLSPPGRAPVVDGKVGPRPSAGRARTERGQKQKGSRPPWGEGRPAVGWQRGAGAGPVSAVFSGESEAGGRGDSSLGAFGEDTEASSPLCAGGCPLENI